jgi:hypothetical protein
VTPNMMELTARSLTDPPTATVPPHSSRCSATCVRRGGPGVLVSLLSLYIYIFFVCVRERSTLPHTPTPLLHTPVLYIRIYENNNNEINKKKEAGEANSFVGGLLALAMRCSRPAPLLLRI